MIASPRPTNLPNYLPGLATYSTGPQVSYRCMEATELIWGRMNATEWRRLVIVGRVPMEDESLIVQWIGGVVPPCFYSDDEALTLARQAREITAEQHSLGRGSKRRVPAPAATIDGRAPIKARCIAIRGEAGSRSDNTGSSGSGIM